MVRALGLCVAWIQEDLPKARDRNSSESADVKDVAISVIHFLTDHPADADCKKGVESWEYAYSTERPRLILASDAVKQVTAVYNIAGYKSDPEPPFGIQLRSLRLGYCVR